MGQIAQRKDPIQNQRLLPYWETRIHQRLHSFYKLYIYTFSLFTSFHYSLFNLFSLCKIHTKLSTFFNHFQWKPHHPQQLSPTPFHFQVSNKKFSLFMQNYILWFNSTLNPINILKKILGCFNILESISFMNSCSFFFFCRKI